MYSGDTVGGDSRFADIDSEVAFEALSAAARTQTLFVVLGAGPSYGHFGSWRELFDRALSRHGRTHSEVGAGSWALDRLFGSLIDLVGEAPFLAGLKTDLDTSGRTVPLAYETVVRIPAAHVVATFNYDDFLALAAGHVGTSVSAYPSPRVPQLERAALYLHGRVATASDCAELVISDHHYAAAYSTQTSELAVTLMFLMMNCVTVYIGTSWTDEDFRQFRTGARTLRRLRDANSPIRSQWPQEFIFVQALGSLEQVAVLRRELQRDGLEPIFYSSTDTSDHEQLQSLLEDMVMVEPLSGRVSSNPDAAWVVNRASRLARIEVPTNHDLDSVAVLVTSASAERAFFTTPPSVGWLSALARAGLLSPKPANLVGPGQWSAPPWPAGDYLLQLASTAASGEVAEFLVSAETDNWIAVMRMTAILQALPSGAMEVAAPALPKWLSARFAPGFAVAEAIVSILRRLAKKNSSTVLRRQLFDGLLRWAINLDSRDPMASLDGQRLLDAVSVVAPVDSRHVVAALEGAMQEFAEREWKSPASDVSWSERPAIEPHPQNGQRQDSLDVLIEALREATRHLSDRAYRNTVKRWIASPWPIWQRMAMAEAYYDDRALGIVLQALSGNLRTALSDQAIVHELSTLLRSRLQLPPDLVEELQSAIDGLLSAPETERRGNRWLHVVPAELLSALQRKIVADQGWEFEESLTFNVFWGVGGFVSPPLTADSFAQACRGKSSEEILRLVRHPEEFGFQVDWQHSLGLMWELLSDWAVKEGRSEVFTAIPALEAASLERAHAVFPAAARACSDDLARWNLTLDWFTSVAPHAGSGQLQAIADALAIAVRDGIPAQIADRAVSFALEILLDHAQPLSGPIRDVHIRRGDGRVDLAEQYLNSPAGQAAEALYLAAHRGSSAERRNPLPEWLRKLLFVAANDGTGGMETRVLAGALFTVSHWREPDLAEAVLPLLLPMEGGVPLEWEAFLTGHLWRNSKVYEGSAAALAPFWPTALMVLDESTHVSDHLKLQLLTHIAIGANNGIGQDRETFLGTASGPAARRDHAMAAIAGLLGRAEDPELFAGLCDLADDFLRSHTESEDPPISPSWGGYARWLTPLQSRPDLFEAAFMAMLRSDVLGWEIHISIDSLLPLASDAPSIAVRCLFALAEKYGSNQEFVWSAKEIKGVIRVVAEAGYPHASSLTQLISMCLEAGVIDRLEANSILGTADIKPPLPTPPSTSTPPSDTLHP